MVDGRGTLAAPRGCRARARSRCASQRQHLSRAYTQRGRVTHEWRIVPRIGQIEASLCAMRHAPRAVRQQPLRGDASTTVGVYALCGVGPVSASVNGRQFVVRAMVIGVARPPHPTHDGTTYYPPARLRSCALSSRQAPRSEPEVARRALSELCLARAVTPRKLPGASYHPHRLLDGQLGPTRGNAAAAS